MDLTNVVSEFRDAKTKYLAALMAQREELDKLIAEVGGKPDEPDEPAPRTINGLTSPCGKAVLALVTRDPGHTSGYYASALASKFARTNTEQQVRYLVTKGALRTDGKKYGRKFYPVK